MQIEINGEPRDVAEKVSLVDLVLELSLSPDRVAIELNKNVVRRADWPDTTIAAGDRIEIVHFVGGGSSRSPRISKGLSAASNQPSLTVGLLMPRNWV